MGSAQKLKTVTAYLSGISSADARAMAKELRRVIKEAAPDAEEVITYNMPGYKWNGFLVSFAVWKEHIGLYPRTRAMEEAIPAVKKYEGAKGTMKFPLSEPLPVTLIRKIVRFRLKENSPAVKGKKVAKKKQKG